MKCRGCGAPIVWIKMKYSGKAMPVDEEPVQVLLGEGTDSFVRGDGIVIIGQAVGDAWDDDPNAKVEEAYVSHFATCRKANQYRKR